MTPILVLNDALEEILANPKAFVDEIVEHGYGYTKNVFSRFSSRILNTKHADTPRVLLAWQNELSELNVTINFMSDSELDNLENQIKVAERELKFTKDEIKRYKHKNRNVSRK